LDTGLNVIEAGYREGNDTINGPLPGGVSAPANHVLSISHAARLMAQRAAPARETRAVEVRKSADTKTRTPGGPLLLRPRSGPLPSDLDTTA
jgi:hypothetical protein